MKEKQIFKYNWQGIDIKISFIPDYSKGFREIMGVSQSHIEVRANQPLPITNTGYRSLFLTLPEVEKEGGAEKLVQNWLHEASKSKEWKEYISSKMQLPLF